MEHLYNWGIDLGGTKIECAVLDRQDPTKVIHRERIDTESVKGYDHIMAQVGRLIDSVSEKLGFRPEQIGFATPGVLDPTSQTMKNCNTTSMNGKPMAVDLARVVGCEVRLANDANCFALAEALLGAVQDVNPKAQIVFGIIMGTGVGGGLVVHGQVVNGFHGIGGEWGHNILEDGGDPCYCGKSGCVEKVISGPALELFYERQTGQKRKLKEIVQAYQDHSDPAVDLVEASAAAVSAPAQAVSGVVVLEVVAEEVVEAEAKVADVVDAVAVVIMAAETEAGDARTVTNVWIDAGSDPA